MPSTGFDWRLSTQTRNARAAAPLAGMLALGSCGGDASPADAGFAGQRAVQATPVEVLVAARSSVARTVTVSGVVEPLRAVGVNAQLAGALLTVRVEEGSLVRAGDVLAEVDAREIAAQVRSAEANLTLARSAAERAERLWRDQIITVAEYERDRAALAASEAQLDLLRARLGYATVRSPIAGVVTEKLVEAGDVVGSLTRLFTLADVGTLVIRVQFSELDVASLKAGDPVSIAVDALPGRPLRARIRRIFPAADAATRLVPVEVALSGADASRVMPGFLARVTFSIGERDDAIVVPAGAVLGEGGSTGVFLVKQGGAHRAPVRLGLVNRGQIEVLEGLAPGDSVVVAGHVGLRDGVPVRVVPPVVITDPPGPVSEGEESSP